MSTATQKKYSRHAIATLTAIASFIPPLLAKDVKLDPRFMRDVNKKNFHEKRASILENITKQVTPCLAQDANLEGIHQLLDSLDPEAKDADEPAPGLTEPIPVKAEAVDDDPHGLRDMLKGKMSDDDVNGLIAHINGHAIDEKDDNEDPEAKDEPPPFAGRPEVGKGPPGKDRARGKDKGMGKDAAPITKGAMDAAISAATDATRKSVMTEQKAIRDAERAVRPWTGELQVAFDSADEVYKHALEVMGVKNVADIHPSAYRTILEMQPKPGTKKQAQDAKDTTIAVDEATMKSFTDLYPHAAKIQIHQ